MIYIEKEIKRLKRRVLILEITLVVLLGLLIFGCTTAPQRDVSPSDGLIMASDGPPTPPGADGGGEVTNRIVTYCIFDLNYDVWYPEYDPPYNETNHYTWVSIDTGLPQFSDVQFVDAVHTYNPSNQYPYTVAYRTNDNLVTGTWRNYAGHTFDWGNAWSHWWVGFRHYSVTNDL